MVFTDLYSHYLGEKSQDPVRVVHLIKHRKGRYLQIQTHCLTSLQPSPRLPIPEAPVTQTHPDVMWFKLRSQLLPKGVAGTPPANYCA